MKRVLLILALVACKKVERLPTTAAPDPVVVQQQPAQRPPPVQVPAPVGCVADRITNLTMTVGELPDCSVDETWCRTECARDNGGACFALATQMQNTQKDTATNLFARACELGLAIACTNYGASVWTEGSDATCPRRVFEKACAVKEPYACGMLGRMAVASAKDDASRASARALLQKQCDEFTGPPCKMLADHLKSGELGQYEPALIPVLLKKACDGGDPAACDDLQQGGTGSN